MSCNFTLLAVGDIWLKTKDGSDPFYKVQEALSEGDIVFGNLEVVLSESPVRAKKAHILYENPEKVCYLKDAGFDVVNIANNHILDLGVEGFHDTLHLLEENSIDYVGGSHSKDENRAVIIERNGIRLGFLGYTSGRWRVPKEIAINKIKEAEILRDIAELKKSCDHVIVSLHWGIEHVHYPSPDQIDLAHRIIDQGASVILGHHPHALQGIEEYHGSLIAYSLGNFQFHTESPFEGVNKTIIFSIVFNSREVQRYSTIPCVIDNNYQPTLELKSQGEELSSFLSEISRPLEEGTIQQSWWFETIAENYLSNNLTSYKKRIREHGITHLLECCVWLMTPFCIRCYLGCISKLIKNKIEMSD